MVIKMTRAEYEAKYGTKPPIATTSVPKEQKQSYMQDAFGDIKQAGQEIGSSWKKRSAKLGESIEAKGKGEQGLMRTMLHGIGQGLGAVSDTIGAGAKGIVKAFLPEKAEKSVSTNIQGIGETISSIQPVQKISQKFEELKVKNPKLARDIDSAFGGLSLLLDVGTGGAGGVAAKGAKRVAGEAFEQVSEQVGKQVGRGVRATARAVEPVKKFATGVKDVGVMTVEGVAKIPSRVATNVAQKQTERQVIKSLPGKMAQRAAEGGIDVEDVKRVISIPKQQKSKARELAKTVREFASGKSKVEPQEVVGKPMVAGIRRLESARGRIGKKLGDVANNLGEVTDKEIIPAIEQQLKRVPGLEDLKIGVTDDGLLDLSQTVLANAPEAKRIQQLFLEATQSGTGKSKHLTRQRLFEELGGKKRALVNLTDTEERVYEAIRKGLADVLEAKNPAYKKLNQQYAKIAEPLKRLRKFFKGTEGADEDILNLKAGNLARRLTSNVQSRAELKTILRDMDNALKTKGKTLVNLETLQDLYNVLDKYYDIAPKTGFKGQIKAGIESVDSLQGAILQKVKGFAGETPAVRQKALENLLDDILR